MSEEHAPSDFADQGTEYIVEDYAEILGNDFGPDLPFNDAGELVIGQDLANVESNGVTAQDPMASEAENAEDTIRLAGELESSQNGISTFDARGQASSGTNVQALGDTVQATFGPTQPSFAGEDLPAAHLSEEDQIWRDHEGLSDFQYGGRDNGQQQPSVDSNWARWKEIEALAANGNFSEIVDPVYQEPYSHGNFDNTIHPAPTRVDSQQPTNVNEHGMNSAFGTTSMSGGTTRGPAPTASNGLGNTIYNPSLGNTQGASAGRNPIVNTFTENAKDDRSDQSDESDRSDEDDEDDEDVPNHVTFDTYEENDAAIVQNALRKGRGRTGLRYGHQVWFNPRTLKWQPSATHHDMRETLIARAQAEYPNHRYRHPDPVDGLPHGETSYFKSHQNRGPNRQDCADILFEWREYQPKKDEQGKRIRPEKPKYIRKHPGFMYEDDRILLDPHDNPVVNHKFIPLTLSAHTSGAKLQEMYLNPDVHHVDLWARMPRFERMKDKKTGNIVVVELRGKNTRINMPMTRFREKKGTIAGEDREGSDVIRDGLLNIYRQNGFDPVASGSTKGFWRDLQGWEVKQVRMGNAAMFGKRAGNRAISEGKRQENLQKTQKSIENGKRRRAAENGDDTGNRPRNQIVDDDESGLAPSKRVYREPEFAPSHIRVGQSSAQGTSGGSSRQGRGNTASSSKTQRYGTHGAVQTPHQNPNPMAVYQQPQFPNYNNNHYQPSYPGFGMGNAPHLEHFQPNIQQGGPTWPDQSQYQTNGKLNTQHGPAQSVPWQPSANSTYAPAHILRQAWDAETYDMPSPVLGYGFQIANNGYALPQNRGVRRERVVDEAEYNPYVTEENRQQMLRQGRSDEFARANMVQKRPMSDANPGYSFPGRLAVERQAPSDNTNGAVKANGNTLGRGGHQTYQAPDQVLEKRRQQGADGASASNQYPESSTPDFTNEIQQGEAISQAISDSDVGQSQKRQRNNGIQGPEPRPQHRRRGGKAPQSKRYGAGGAPEPVFLPAQSFEALNATTVIIDDAEGPMISPEELLAAMPEIFNFDQNAKVQGVSKANQNVSTANGRPHGLTAQDPSDRDVSVGLGPTMTSNRIEDHGINGAPNEHLSHLQGILECYETHQVLGKHRRREPMEQRGEDTYVPQQDPVQQGPEEHIANDEKKKDIPAPKRWRMPATEGYYSPPVQAPKAQALKKARNAERDAHLAPPQLNINEIVPQESEVPQEAETHLTPSHVFENGTLGGYNDASEAEDALLPQTKSNVDSETPIVYQSPRVADAQEPDPPHAPSPAPTDQGVPLDIRDVRPADGWQSQSLQNALSFTREAYSEWTGEDAPGTNVEECFSQQYRMIHNAFQIWWGSERNPERSDPLPELYQVEAWNGTVTDWSAPQNIEHLWEPMRRGRWAPRNSDGSLQEPQHHWNAEKYDWYDAKVVGEL